MKRYKIKVFICERCGEDFAISERDQKYLEERKKSTDFKFCKTCFKEERGTIR